MEAGDVHSLSQVEAVRSMPLRPGIKMQVVAILGELVVIALSENTVLGVFRSVVGAPVAFCRLIHILTPFHAANLGRTGRECYQNSEARQGFC
jgi:hypothetical protein